MRVMSLTDQDPFNVFQLLQSFPLSLLIFISSFPQVFVSSRNTGYTIVFRSFTITSISLHYAHARSFVKYPQHRIFPSNRLSK